MRACTVSIVNAAPKRAFGVRLAAVSGTQAPESTARASDGNRAGSRIARPAKRPMTRFMESPGQEMESKRGAAGWERGKGYAYPEPRSNGDVRLRLPCAEEPPDDASPPRPRRWEPGSPLRPPRPPEDLRQVRRLPVQQEPHPEDARRQ